MEHVSNGVNKRVRNQLSHNDSPSHDKVKREDDTPPDSRKVKNRRNHRFLERWEVRDDHVGRENETGKPIGDGKSKDALPYIYQQAEFVRITADLIRKCNFESGLRRFLSVLDKGGTIDLNDYADAQVRKKIRHLAKALYLSRNDSCLAKPDECNISLLEALEEKMSYIRQKVEAQGPYIRPARTENNFEGHTSSNDKASNEGLNAKEMAEMMSLREMHEQGFFVDYENVQKEFMDKHALQDVWGKTPQQQMHLMMKKNASKLNGEEEESQPWNVFDREKEIVSSSKIDKMSYERLIQSNKDFTESFTKGKCYSSFI
ncbi:hypothetical protein BgAZ_302220 [Babesia gibsoni]|uniref:Uncharacterized protein n=1 Tax=Babesia gibsoni TaxID=33632 RepID=A0AAD8LKW6_BABGI|nr:hypothetical protein BgAZ_302220 [Babesia gibsoni]